MVNTSVESSDTNVAHLLRRAGWGGNPSEIASAATAGVGPTIDRLLDVEAAPPGGDAFRTDGLEAYDPVEFTIWWYHLATTSSTAGVERLAWFWHGHFATAIQKVRYPSLLRDQLVTLRRHGQGRFDDLLELMSRDTAMNIWLDLHTSVVSRPNENFARELMELFSLGVDGGYTQTDVSEAGRAFTGYALMRDPDVPRRPIGTELRPELHDHGVKTVLGTTGVLDGSDVIQAIVARPECHRFIVRRLWERYAGTEPDDGLVERLAAVFATRLDVGDAVRELLAAEEFYRPEVKAGLVAQPVETLVRTLRNFDLDVPDLSGTPLDDAPQDVRRDARRVVQWSRLLGQMPGFPPNVGGWPHNEGWLTSDRAAGRLTVGLQIGQVFASSDTPLADQFRDTSRDDLAEALLHQFGLVEWSEATLAAARTTATAASSVSDALASTFALVFTSPEVTLT